MDSVKPTFAIAIPTINQWDLFKPFLESYFSSFPLTDIYVLDNGNQNIDSVDLMLHIIKPAERMSVAASWNHMCNLIFKKHNYALVLNDDVLLDKTIGQLIDFLTLHANHDFFVSQHGLCSFVLPKRTFRSIGSFDENFKGAYFEDTDYEMRIKLAKLKVLRHSFLNPKIYNVSSSIKKDKSLNDNFENNRDYYIRKWGGTVGGETYLTPFNK